MCAVRQRYYYYYYIRVHGGIDFFPVFVNGGGGGGTGITAYKTCSADVVEWKRKKKPWATDEGETTGRDGCSGLRVTPPGDRVNEGGKKKEKKKNTHTNEITCC